MGSKKNYNMNGTTRCFSIGFLLPLLGLLLIGYTSTQAQADYNVGIGLRAGPYSGIGIKFFTPKSDVVGHNIIVGGRLFNMVPPSVPSGWNTRLTYLYTFHFNLSKKNENWNLLTGIGGHIGARKRGQSNSPEYPVVQLEYGVDVLLGIEYTFYPLPMSLQFDIKPTLELLGGTHARWDEIGVTLRYVF